MTTEDRFKGVVGKIDEGVVISGICSPPAVEKFYLAPEMFCLLHKLLNSDVKKICHPVGKQQKLSYVFPFCALKGIGRL